ncbi:uncharacterized protein EURHEDRAFT_414237 [Aspergillus ruber CBS 135680]|uniref:Uncharacterized protein n=1 Tax=Aspergillus ruber (strain CBS 135680) TaxID=1388766 RepID=A0A017S8Z6_ASPRC|nr:uncharacterized protein EURHEDRAFT_414237 [Aspergillus ruber CBS 135680]EYE93432.1 hypothetical protein EURHEDRAFT_414237 [Aspergillus ruber CBS 135680]
MTSAQETVSPSEKHIQEKSTDYESLFNNPLWTTNPDLTQPTSEIKFAIRYHETVKPEEQYGSKKAFFKHGSHVEEKEFKHSQECNCIGGWAEPPYESPWCKIIDERVDDSNKHAPEEIEAKAEKKREKEPSEFNKNMLHGLGRYRPYQHHTTFSCYLSLIDYSSMLKPFRRLTKTVRN